MKMVKKKIKFLSEKDKAVIFNFLKMNYGIENFDIFKNYDFLEINKKVHIINKTHISLVKQFKKMASSIGFYLGKIEKQGFRLSFDACQVLSNYINKFIEINEKEAKSWFKGKNISIQKNIKGFIVLKYNEDFIGVGYAQDRIIKNYVPKERRRI